MLSSGTSRNRKRWQPSGPSLGHSLWSVLADDVDPPTDPVAQDPAQLLAAAGLDPDRWQADFLRSDWQRALLLCTRQAGKSTVSAAAAVWTAIYRAPALTLLLSPSLRQSGELFRKVASFYGMLDRPIPLTAETSLELEMANGSRIIALPGKEATIRGFSGVDLLIVDEASRVDDALYYAVRPMLAVSGGRLVCLSTPFGKRGFFHQEWTEGGDGWHRVKVRADDCPRIPREFLEEERRALGPWWYAQEYEVEFVETTDQVFSHDLIMDAVSGDVQPLLGGNHAA